MGCRWLVREDGSRFVRVEVLLLSLSGLVLPWSTCGHVMFLNGLSQQRMNVKQHIITIVIGIVFADISEKNSNSLCVLLIGFFGNS